MLSYDLGPPAPSPAGECMGELHSVRCFKEIWKVGKVGKVGNVGEVVKVVKVGKVGREGLIMPTWNQL